MPDNKSQNNGDEAFESRVRKVIDAYLKEKESDLDRLVATAIAGGKSPQERQSALRQVVSEVVSESAPDAIKAAKVSKRYALVFGGIALIASVINIFAAVWNGFDQAHTMRVQTLAERASIAQTLITALNVIEAEKASLNEIQATMDARRKAFFYYHGPGTSSWPAQASDYTVDICGSNSSKVGSPAACIEERPYQLIQNPSFSTDPGGQIQMGAALEKLVTDFEELQRKIGSDSSFAVLGVINSARDNCRRPTAIFSATETEQDHEKKQSEDMLQYRRIISLDRAIETLVVKARPILDRYRGARGSEANTVTIASDVNQLQEREFRDAVRGLASVMGTSIEDNFDGRLRLIEFNAIIRNAMTTLATLLPKVFNDCDLAAKDANRAISGVSPRKEEWDKLMVHM